MYHMYVPLCDSPNNPSPTGISEIRNNVGRSIRFIGALILVCLGCCVVPGFTRQPNPSNWTVILSGPEPANETVIKDQFQEIAVSGSTVHVMWIADGYDKYYLYYRRSLDNGITWEQTKLLQTGATIWASNYVSKRMAVDGNDVHIVVGYIKGGRTYLNYFRSTNSGVSFASPQEFGPYTQSYHHISASQGTVAITIANNTYGGNGTMWALVSKDRGASFSAVQIQTASGWQFDSGDVLVYGGRVYVLYLRPINVANDSPQELYFVSVGTDGRSVSQPTKISTPAQNQTDGRNYSTLNDQHYTPSIAADGNFVYVVWSGVDQYGAFGAWQFSVYFRRSADYGASFGSAISLNQWSAGVSNNNALETIAASGGRVYVVYLAARGTTNTNVMLVRSDNNADSFYAAQTLHSSGWWPSVAIDPSDASGKSAAVLLHWPAILKTKDGGSTWRGPQAIVPYQATYTNYERPQFAWGPNDSIHSVVDGWFTFGGDSDSDVIYRRVVPPSAPSGHQALSLVTDQASNPPDARRYDEMQVGMSPGFSAINNAITIEYWMKPKRVDGYYYYPVYKAEPGNSFPVYGLGWGRTGQPDARIITAHGQFQLYGGLVLTNDTWVHVALTYDAGAGTGNLKLYENGKLSGQVTATGALKTGTGPLHIGSNFCETSQSVIIDELRIWNRALTEADIKDVMSKYLTGSESGLVTYYNFDNSTKDVTGHGNDGVLLGRESFVDGYIPPNTVFRKDFFGTWALGGGTYYRNSDTGEWVNVTSAANQILVGDIDGDGKDDLIGNWYGSGVWAKYSSTGKWVQMGSPADFITLTYLPGDQIADLAGIWGGVIFIRDSATTFWSTLEVGASQVTLVDLDGDGKPDLVGTWPGSGVWVKYSQTGQWAKLGSPAQWITAGDFNGDGIKDLIGIWDSNIYGRDTVTKSWTLISAGATQVVLGDMDGDGKDDLVGSWSSGAWVKYSSSGNWERLSSPPDSMAIGRIR